MENIALSDSVDPWSVPTDPDYGLIMCDEAKVVKCDDESSSDEWSEDDYPPMSSFNFDFRSAHYYYVSNISGLDCMAEFVQSADTVIEEKIVVHYVSRSCFAGCVRQPREEVERDANRAILRFRREAAAVHFDFIAVEARTHLLWVSIPTKVLRWPSQGICGFWRPEFADNRRGFGRSFAVEEQRLINKRHLDYVSIHSLDREPVMP